MPQILDDAYVALKEVDPTNIVIGGNTFSGGDIKPLAYIKAMRLPNGKPPRMDLYGHNPFGYRRPDLSKDQINPRSGIADFCDLDVVALTSTATYRGPAATSSKLRLFLSEYFVPTDHPNWEFNYWVRRKTAANWLAAALQDHPQLAPHLHAGLVRSLRRQAGRRRHRGQPRPAHLRRRQEARLLRVQARLALLRDTAGRRRRRLLR